MANFTKVRDEVRDEGREEVRDEGKDEGRGEAEVVWAAFFFATTIGLLFRFFSLRRYTA